MKTLNNIAIETNWYRFKSGIKRGLNSARQDFLLFLKGNNIDDNNKESQSLLNCKVFNDKMSFIRLSFWETNLYFTQEADLTEEETEMLYNFIREYRTSILHLGFLEYSDGSTCCTKVSSRHRINYLFALLLFGNFLKYKRLNHKYFTKKTYLFACNSFYTIFNIRSYSKNFNEEYRLDYLKEYTMHDLTTMDPKAVFSLIGSENLIECAKENKNILEETIFLNILRDSRNEKFIIDVINSEFINEKFSSNQLYNTVFNILLSYIGTGITDLYKLWILFYKKFINNQSEEFPNAIEFLETCMDLTTRKKIISSSESPAELRLLLELN